MNYIVDVNELYPNGLEFGDIKDIGKDFITFVDNLDGIYAKKVLNSTIEEISNKTQFYEQNAKICKRTDKLINESKALALRELFTQITDICGRIKEEMDGDEL